MLTRTNEADYGMRKSLSHRFPKITTKKRPPSLEGAYYLLSTL